MAERFSTGLRNYLLGEGSFRKAFENGKIEIRSGTAPTEADDVGSGTLLLTVTKASGALSAAARAIPKIHHLTAITHASCATVALGVLVDGVSATYTHTNFPDLDAAPMMVKVAQMLNDIPQLDAVPDVTAAEIYVKSRVDGLDFTIVDAGGIVSVTVDAAVQAAAEVNSTHFGVPSAGVISKVSDVWSGSASATGTAGYFRLVTADDDNSDSSTALRYQGVVATSGGELDVATVNLTAGVTYTIDTFSITFPAE